MGISRQPALGCIMSFRFVLCVYGFAQSGACRGHTGPTGCQSWEDHRRQGDLCSITEPARSAAEMEPGLLTAVEGLLRVEALLQMEPAPLARWRTPGRPDFYWGFPGHGGPVGSMEKLSGRQRRSEELGLVCPMFGLFLPPVSLGS